MESIIDTEELRKFCDLVFKPFFEEEKNNNECLEFIYDSGDLNYAYAFHRSINQDYESFLKSLIESVMGLNLVGSNISTFTTTFISTKTEGRAPRSKKSDALRASAWIVEIEPSKEQKIALVKDGLLPLSPKNKGSLEIVRDYLQKVIPFFPDDIKKAVAGIYLTGGGINLIVKFNRLATKKEIQKLNNLFKRIVLDLRRINLPIDESCWDIVHAQRLPGTLNHKYKGNLVSFIDRDEFLKENGEIIPYEPLNIDNLFVDKLKIDKESMKAIEENEIKAKAITDYKESIEELLMNVDIPKIFNLDIVKENSNYYLVRCPFHPPDKNPSFVVYKNLDSSGKQIAVDMHDGKAYDAIELAKILWNLDFVGAVKELGELTGITPEIAKTKRKKRKEQIEKNSSGDDILDNINLEAEAEKWLMSIGVDLNSVKMIVEEGGNVVSFEMEIKSPLKDNNKIKMILNDKIFQNPNALLNKLRLFSVNKNIVFPYDKTKEVREFVMQVFSELVYRSYLNKNYELDKDKLTILHQELIKIINLAKNNTKSLIEFIQSGSGVCYDDGLITGKKGFLLPLSGIYEHFSRIKALGKMDFRLFKFLISESPYLKTIDLKVGTELPALFVSEELLKEYEKELKNVTNVSEELIDAVVSEVNEVSLEIEKKEEELGVEKKEEVATNQLDEIDLEGVSELDLDSDEDFNFDF